eukprot:5897378-Pleurochrysis_carterae.AAC.2
MQGFRAGSCVRAVGEVRASETPAERRHCPPAALELLASHGSGAGAKRRRRVAHSLHRHDWQAVSLLPCFILLAPC